MKVSADSCREVCNDVNTKTKMTSLRVYWLIREDLDSCPHEPPSFYKFDGPHVSMFKPVTEEFIPRLISQSTRKCCTLDPIPATLTKQCLHDQLAHLVTRIVSVSVSAGTVQSWLKQALGTPIMKQPGLESNDLRNFRPTSNLQFISKIQERVVLLQLQSHFAQIAYLQHRNCCLECIRRPPYKF